ncbi:MULTISPECIES: hypothetical protein [Microcoleaceae]|nr:hypothetical protein [Tychonema sp. LEGE 06208]MBE9160861.1 hypothetical protein [Tychonema sp. LEGE 06208]
MYKGSGRWDLQQRPVNSGEVRSRLRQIYASFFAKKPSIDIIQFGGARV